ncbi:MAG: MFS transporter, partial [Acidobacteriaceae bacterium]
MSDSRRTHDSAAPALPLGEGASSASAALPDAAIRDRHPLHPVRGVVSVFVCGLIAFLTLYATQPLLPLLENLFHASKSAVGWTVSASTLGVAIAAPLLGTFTERMNRKRVILISILLLAVPTCAAASSTSLGWLVFWRLLQGLITPGVFATTIAYITENWPPTAVAPVMSIYVSGTALGGFSGRAVTGFMAD